MCKGVECQKKRLVVKEGWYSRVGYVGGGETFFQVAGAVIGEGVIIKRRNRFFFREQRLPVHLKDVFSSAVQQPRRCPTNTKSPKKGLLHILCLFDEAGVPLPSVEQVTDLMIDKGQEQLTQIDAELECEGGIIVPEGVILEGCKRVYDLGSNGNTDIKRTKREVLGPLGQQLVDDIERALLDERARVRDLEQELVAARAASVEDRKRAEDLEEELFVARATVTEAYERAEMLELEAEVDAVEQRCRRERATSLLFKVYAEVM